MKKWKLVRRRPAVRGRAWPPSLADAADHGVIPAITAIRRSPLVRPALPDQLSAQLRPRPRARHLRLL